VLSRFSSSASEAVVHRMATSCIILRIPKSTRRWSGDESYEVLNEPYAEQRERVGGNRE
jgi:hypothetical protein